jgi:hypothetical protein
MVKQNQGANVKSREQVKSMVLSQNHMMRQNQDAKA